MFGTKDGVVYAVRAPNGIDVNKVLGKESPFPEEKEITIPYVVKLTQILGATPVKSDGSYIGYSILNLRSIDNGKETSTSQI